MRTSLSLLILFGLFLLSTVILAKEVVYKTPKLFAPSIFRGVEITTSFKKENDRNFSDDMSASIRLHLKGGSERSLENNIYKLRQNSFSKNIEINKYIKNSSYYTKFSQLQKIKIDIDYQQKLQVILKKKKKLLEYSSKKRGLRHISDLIVLSEQMEHSVSLSLRLRSLEKRLISELQFVVKNSRKRTLFLNPDDTVSIDEIHKFTKVVDRESVLSDVLSAEQLKLLELKSEVALDSVKSNRILDIMEFEVSKENTYSKIGSDSELFYLLKFRFSLPWFTVRDNKKIIDHQMQSLGIQEQRNNNSFEFDNMIVDLELEIINYQNIQNSHLSKIFKKYSKSKDRFHQEYPLEILNFEERKLKYSYGLLKTEMEVKSKFLALIIKGQLPLSLYKKNLFLLRNIDG